MALTKNAMFVEAAIERRRGSAVLTKSLTPSMEGLDTVLLDSVERSEKRASLGRKREPYAHALSLVNDHITVKQSVVDEAAAAYEDIASRLASKLNWPPGAIKIFPQGSASTKTLIRTIGNRKFDIDAVCEVDISMLEAQDPMGFFDAFGTALDGLNVERKRRCWNINIVDKPFYLEFTPSVPLRTIPLTARQMHGLNNPELEFASTALAVVDNPSRDWKTSNPAGIRDWVNRASDRSIVLEPTLEAFDSVRASVEPVVRQSVEVEETLRVAIRLFKRHRDICVHRGHLSADAQPISIILVTLLTTCYEGLADLIDDGTRVPFVHVVDALIALAELLPDMIPYYPELGYYLANPTVVDENFAERWNTDDGERAEAFRTWCGLLRADLVAIAALDDPDEMTAKTLEVFGCTAAVGPKGGNGNSGPRPTLPSPPPPAPRTSGLA
ncbi:nucleotidyltransferase domain-containing protein [Burkholderia multivorans]|uniref:nucleotidyltransferase domain-containing protein n=1 Tax=Burkholderia multivorans TaxID=87883 RepID=UPI001C22EB69|nr:nucleotidyltransferase [Burkholderia multivorans]MBU9477670.1 nucleotidyltransferase [Burkholderia multivorans]